VIAPEVNVNKTQNIKFYIPVPHKSQDLTIVISYLLKGEIQVVDLKALKDN
jgi:hypothetical protein